MKVSDISAKIMARLLSDQGTSDYWNITDIELDLNWLYQDTARTFKCCKTRNASINSAINIARYVIPKNANATSILSVSKVEYDNEEVSFYPLSVIEEMDYRWRSLGSGKPWACTFEDGDEDIAITFIPKLPEIKSLAFSYSYMPIELTSADTPVAPFDDGLILFDGLMSMQLAKAGGGRDLDRADWWLGQFVSKCSSFSQHKGFGVRSIKSIDSPSGKSIGQVRLPSNYPTYHFN